MASKLNHALPEMGRIVTKKSIFKYTPYFLYISNSFRCLYFVGYFKYIYDMYFLLLHTIHYRNTWPEKKLKTVQQLLRHKISVFLRTHGIVLPHWLKNETIFRPQICLRRRNEISESIPPKYRFHTKYLNFSMNIAAHCGHWQSVLRLPS